MVPRLSRWFKHRANKTKLTSSVHRPRFCPRLLGLEERVNPGAGQLDPTFGTGGLVTTRFPSPSFDVGQGATVDSLGRLIVTGNTSSSLGGTDAARTAVTRYTVSGVLDTSFGATGIVVIPFGTPSAVAVDSNDRIIIAGDISDGSNYHFAVIRLTTAGDLDPTFGGDGKQTIAFGTSNDYATAVAVDSANRVVVAGYTYNGSTTDFAVARLTTTGDLDSTFDSDGKQIIAFGPLNDSACGVAVDSADRVIVAGSTNNGSNFDFAVARLTNVGLLDMSFAGDGKQTIAFGAADDGASGV